MLDNTPVVLTEDFTFSAGEAELSARLYMPVSAPDVAVVVHAATGVPRDYYQHFARWLVEEQGMACLTYDYRDFGHSLRGRLRDSQATMADWALINMPAARAEMRRRFPAAQQWSIGHSVGGMLGPIQPDIEQIDRMICVCSGLVTVSDHPWPYRALATMFWYAHPPLLVKALGYLPGKALGFGSDLPARVYWQWRKWCTAELSYVPDIGKSLPDALWAASETPVDLFTMDDDQVVPPNAVWRLADLYGPKARRHQLSPKDFGLAEVGHIGAFARRNAAIWPRLIA
ncbi:alpha/beta hydrolase family protein [Ruegeria atlantica]|uniref:Alpha/beta hydrolase family protein n=1 Tax=Ruegeria atlantica TaxID=81569 RepID=A0A0P1E2L2_9RHOB|nr:alpha/beta hydrolase [Ruegeria atlantica]CUH42438.1 Alpha/beta hydrolase family protein [Ruegeria atlantica]